MLANVTHELKTPLNTITASVEQLFKEAKSEKEIRNLKRIKQAVYLMLALVNDIIDNSKYDNGGIELHNEHFILEELFEEL